MPLFFRLSVIGYRLSVIGYRLSTPHMAKSQTSYRIFSTLGLPRTFSSAEPNLKPPTSNLQPQISNLKSQIYTLFQLFITKYLKVF